jgi:enolase
MPVDDQWAIDQKLIALDGSTRKERLGGNTLTAVSLAVSRAAALSLDQPLYRYIAALAKTTPALPTPLCVVIEGGQHAAKTKLTFQEFLIAGEFNQARQIYEALSAKFSSETGLEGAFAPNIGNTQALNILVETCEKLNLTAGDNVLLGIDLAATTLERPPDVAEIVNLMGDFPVGLLEDPLPDEAWHLWAQLKLELDDLGRNIMLVGDDLFVTNPDRVQKGINGRLANAILIKPNQVGTLSETLSVIDLARKAGFTYIVSHRSGETMDDYIADLAVGTAAAYLKAGSPSENFPERMVKYKRLAEIADELTQNR